MCNAPDYITEAYKRFVANQIRKSFDFRAVPITVEYRARKRNENAPPSVVMSRSRKMPRAH
jgi:predicted GTPase